MQESKVTSKGQTTLPREVRIALKRQSGDRVRYLLSEGAVRILKARPVMSLEGALKRSGQKSISLDEMEEAIAAGGSAQSG